MAAQAFAFENLIDDAGKNRLLIGRGGAQRISGESGSEEGDGREARMIHGWM
jgi:hypothetical protein